MSGFLSPKYLKYRRPEALGKIEDDLACQGCGYNLRGLNYGRACPECAAPIERGVAFDDMLLARRGRARSMLRAGLGIATACLFAATAARVVFFLLGARGASTGQAVAYLAFGLTAAVAWTVASWLVTPRALDRSWRSMRPLRWAIRITQPLWIIAYVLWLIAILDSNDSLGAVARGLRAVAGVGAILLAYVLGRLAANAEREAAACRLNAVVWLLPPLTLIPQIFRGNIAWFELVLLGMFLLPWVWVMLLFALAVLEIQQHVAWTAVHARERHTRSGRVAEVRRALDEEVKAQIRPLPPDAPDLPFDPPTERLDR